MSSVVSMRMRRVVLRPKELRCMCRVLRVAMLVGLSDAAVDVSVVDRHSLRVHRRRAHYDASCRKSCSRFALTTSTSILPSLLPDAVTVTMTHL